MGRAITRDNAKIWYTVALLTLATILVYANSFTVPFVFDDLPAIADNLTIRHLWPIWNVLLPPIGTTVGGRPLVNVTLALNYAVSGTAVWSYHLVNLLIHLGAGLALFGIIRRTLVRMQRADAALPLAAIIALIWLVHPLQTESVTYVVQRAESMVSLCYLLTFYGTMRWIEAPNQRRWRILAIVACTAGMACKEVMVSAPLMMLLYDRTFVTGSFRTTWQERGSFYGGLFCSWILLAVLVMMNGRGASAGFNAHFPAGMTVWTYALTQCRAIVLYLSLAFWPHPLVFDYGVAVDTQVSAVLLQGIVVSLLILATVVALIRRPAIGFLGILFFALLAPSSSFVPITTQSMAEHRIYLALSAVIILTVICVYQIIGQSTLYFGVLAAGALGWTTIQRNRTFQSELSLWSETVALRPLNARAQHYLGDALAALGRPSQALPSLEAAVALDPADQRAQNDLGRVLSQIGNYSGAIEHFSLALKSDPDLFEARFNLGLALVQSNRMDEARTQFEMIVAKQADYPGAQADLADLLALQGRYADAVDHYRSAIRLDPNASALHLSLGRSLSSLTRFAEAAGEFESAISGNPGSAPAHNEYGKVLANLGRLSEAMREFSLALKIDSGFAEAQQNFEMAKRMQSAGGGSGKP